MAVLCSYAHGQRQVHRGATKGQSGCGAGWRGRHCRLRRPLWRRGDCKIARRKFPAQFSLLATTRTRKALRNNSLNATAPHGGARERARGPRRQPRIPFRWRHTVFRLFRRCRRRSKRGLLQLRPRRVAHHRAQQRVRGGGRLPGGLNGGKMAARRFASRIRPYALSRTGTSRFSVPVAKHGNDPEMKPFWQDL